MRRLAALCIVLTAFAFGMPSRLPSAAAAPKAVPLDVSGDGVVMVVKAFPVKVTAQAGADFYIWSFPDGVKASDDGNVLTVTAAPKGVFRVSVVSVTIDFAAKKVTKDRGAVEINVGDVPGPTPDPTPVDNPLTKSFQTAYALDTDADRAKSLAFLQAAYKGMAAQAATRTDLTTNAAFVAWMKTVVSATNVGLTATQLKSLRAAIGAELSAAWGTTSAPLSPAAASAELKKIADALSGVK